MEIIGLAMKEFGGREFLKGPKIGVPHLRKHEEAAIMYLYIFALFIYLLILFLFIY
jgi:hypothetical protein